VKLQHLLFIISTNLFFSGCATVLEYDPAILRFDTPETTGKLFSGNAAVIIANTPNRVLGSINSPIFDEDGDKPNNDSPAEYTQPNITFGQRIDLGIMANTDFYFRSLADTPNIIGIKTQIIGEGRHQNTTGLKMAISAEYGIRATDEQDDGTDRAIRDMYSYDFSANVGFRFNKHLIVYSNSFYNFLYIHGTLDRGVLVYDKQGSGKTFGSLIGIRFGENSIGPFLGVEYGRSLVKWPKTNVTHEIDKEWVNAYGVSVGYTW